MNTRRLRAFAIDGELDLTKLGATLGINRKFRWEEPMLLDPRTLTLSRSVAPSVYLYHFGGVVFVDCDDGAIAAFSDRMRGISRLFSRFPDPQHEEGYAVRLEELGRGTVANDYAILPHASYLDLIASVLAKSVALERIEEQVDALLDDAEDVIGLLGRGKLNLTVKRLARLAADILNHRYRTIASIMVLDKPDVTWEDPEADRIYLTMANMFEIDLRYRELQHKTETLMDITEVFSNLSHAQRSSRLEVIIIALIAVEIVIYLFELLR